jgi:hypothetical protein
MKKNSKLWGLFKWICSGKKYRPLVAVWMGIEACILLTCQPTDSLHTELFELLLKPLLHHNPDFVFLPESMAHKCFLMVPNTWKLQSDRHGLYGLNSNTSDLVLCCPEQNFHCHSLPLSLKHNISIHSMHSSMNFNWLTTLSTKQLKVF